MSLDYKIYQGTKLIAATSEVGQAVYLTGWVAHLLSRVTLKYAGRVVWSDAKDHDTRGYLDMKAIVSNRIEQHRCEAAAKYRRELIEEKTR